VEIRSHLLSGNETGPPPALSLPLCFRIPFLPYFLVSPSSPFFFHIPTRSPLRDPFYACYEFIGNAANTETLQGWSSSFSFFVENFPLVVPEEPPLGFPRSRLVPSSPNFLFFIFIFRTDILAQQFSVLLFPRDSHFNCVSPFPFVFVRLLASYFPLLVSMIT